MRGKSTLRGRLTISYSLALLIALTAFALLSLVTIDSVQRHIVEGELQGVARDESATVAYDSDSDTISAGGAARFGSVAGSRVASALLAQDGRPLVASAARVPDIVARSAASVAATTEMTLSDRGVTLRAVFVPMMNGTIRRATIAVWSDITPIERIDEKLALVFAIAIPLIAGLATLLGSAIARRGLAPLDRMIDDASEIEASDLSARITQPDSAELHRLATTLNRMLERLNAAFERERRFTNDASHEFRAPLAVILAEADLALTAERNATQYKRTLETISIEAEAMERLTRNLLSSARSRGNEAVATEVVDLADIAAMASSRLQILAAQRGISLRVGETAAPPIEGRSDEIEQAVITLLHNAIKFAPPNGTIRLTVRAVADSTELRVADDGPGFSEQALTHAFDRFWQESGSTRSGGHGLGLSIARSIVERYRGSIELANSASGGAIVIVSFRSAAAAVPA
jgi:signal transduction histidine kinase